jgi:hypothetical protein
MRLLGKYPSGYESFGTSDDGQPRLSSSAVSTLQLCSRSRPVNVLLITSMFPWITSFLAIVGKLPLARNAVNVCACRVDEIFPLCRAIVIVVFYRFFQFKKANSI